MLLAKIRDRRKATQTMLKERLDKNFRPILERTRPPEKKQQQHQQPSSSPSTTAKSSAALVEEIGEDRKSSIVSIHNENAVDGSEETSTQKWLNRLEKAKIDSEDRLRDIFVAPIHEVLLGFKPPSYPKTKEEESFLNDAILDGSYFLVWKNTNVGR